MDARQRRIEIGRNLRDARREKGLTQDVLGTRVGVRGNTIATWEKGTRSIRAERLEELCRALNVEMRALLATRQPEQDR